MIADLILSLDARASRLLHLADSELVLSQQLLCWIGHAPMIEEDLGLAKCCA